ncbi:hypothetical protein [Ensifer sp. B1-9]|uniref:hypothetical protein n=1 Tax=Ensifer sp. B1-9 TaxID=3141455 RepID=UPI003D1C7507
MLAKLDGRRREARLMQNVRDELTRHVGGKPTAPQKALIERAAWLSLHCALMDAKLLEGEGPLSERDSREYLAWSNSLTRCLRSLGMGEAPTKPRRSLADIMQEAAA